jgi:hypothetical protein
MIVGSKIVRQMENAAGYTRFASTYSILDTIQDLSHFTSSVVAIYGISIFAHLQSSYHTPSEKWMKNIIDSSMKCIEKCSWMFMSISGG